MEKVNSPFSKILFLPEQQMHRMECFGTGIALVSCPSCASWFQFPFGSGHTAPTVFRRFLTWKFRVEPQYRHRFRQDLQCRKNDIPTVDFWELL